MSEIEKGEIAAEFAKGVMTDEERKSVYLRSGLRRRMQEFKVDLLNLKQSETGEKYKSKYESTLSLVKKEADGSEVIGKEKARRILLEKSADMRNEAKMFEKTASNYSQYLTAYIAKLKEQSGEDYFEEYQKAQNAGKKAENISKITPSNLLGDAILMGIKKRAQDKIPLPEMKNIAEAILGDRALLENYALVLGENEREEFLKLVPEDKKKEIGRTLDTAVSDLLHQSLVEKGTIEEEQRRNVRIRLYRELKDMFTDSGEEKKAVKIIGGAIGMLGEDTRQLMLELIRDEMESSKKDDREISGNLPRVIKIFLDNFDDFRANDITLRLAADEEINPHLSAYLFRKLIEKKYIGEDVGKWLEGEKDKKFALNVLKKSVSQLGIMPSADILQFIAFDKNWKKKEKILNLDERIEEIQKSQKEFDEINDFNKLAKMLEENENKAMLYYMIYRGQDRFDLINNYSFDKFKEMIGLINRFEINERPLGMFKEALLKSGLKDERAEEIISELVKGNYPLENKNNVYQEVSFEISENAALINANRELGRVLGKEQLGVLLAFPLYRVYLEEESGENAKILLEKAKSTATFDERRNLIDKVNADFSDYKEKVINDLKGNWQKFGEKMVLDLSLEQVLSSESVEAKGQELLPRLDVKRIDLKRINKDLIVALRGESPEIKSINEALNKKKKAKRGLEKGLASQTNAEAKEKLSAQIKEIEDDIAGLSKKREALGLKNVDERFAHLSDEEKKDEIERLSKEIIALTEKSPSAIFSYIAMQVLGEERLTENDVNLIREMESHLQGPFQNISDLLTYERGKDTGKKQMRVGLGYLDKTKRFLNMVRFADSKICCFSSNNYNMVVAHETPNKEWVASINKDPLSFVIPMEVPQTGELEERKKVIKQNVGFIFGNYGINEEGQLAILLNGIYYAPGIENARQVNAILNGVENIFKDLPVKTIGIASQYGGSDVGKNLPPEYSNDSVELVRLRALDNGQGRPENKIYDDLGTGNDLNRPHYYGGHVWHKNL